MLVLCVFGLYFVGIGIEITRQKKFYFTRQPITGRAATIAGQANIGTGMLIGLSPVWSDPLPVVGVAMFVFCVGLCAAFACASAS